MRRVCMGVVASAVLVLMACAPPAPTSAPGAAGARASQPTAGASAPAPAASPPEAAARPATPPTKVIACIPSRSDTALAIYSAQEAGYLKEHNIEAEIPYFAGGAVDAAFAAGQCDFIGGAGGIGPLLQGLDVRVVAVLQATLPGQIYAQPSLRTLADLKGRTLGTTGPGSLSWRVGRYLLQVNGLSPEEDVAVMALGDSSSTYGAVLTGRVDSALLFPPQAFMAPKEGLNLLYEPPPSIEFMNTGLVTSQRYLSANRDVVRGMVKGVTDAVVRLKADEGFYGEKMRVFNNQPDLSAEAVREYWQGTGALFNVPPRGTLAGGVLALSLYAERPPDPAMEALAREWLDMSLVDELYPPGATR
jgi:ABC-type nitrate/sulfonate/bicarbonate transport system substrate-binding protein